MYMNGVVREVNARVKGKGLALVDENGEEWIMNQLLFVDNVSSINSK